MFWKSIAPLSLRECTALTHCHWAIDSHICLLSGKEGGRTGAGIHARDSESRFYTIVESIDYASETTGLSLSPDGRFMFVAYQDDGLLFYLYRRDGLPFQAEHLDVKYHTNK